MAPALVALRSVYSHWRLPGITRALRPGVALPGDQKEVGDYSLLINGRRSRCCNTSFSFCTDGEAKLDGAQREEELRLAVGK